MYFKAGKKDDSESDWYSMLLSNQLFSKIYIIIGVE